LTSTFLINCDIAEQYLAYLQENSLRQAATAALEVEGLSGRIIELTIAISNDEEVQELNRSYRGKDSTTDVLSFAAEEELPESPFTLPANARESRYLGDIIISYPQAERQSAEFGNNAAREVQELVIHGVFHLLGYDHEEEADREVMRAREEAATRILDGAPAGELE
jgi:probable rRNA maturation factor